MRKIFRLMMAAVLGALLIPATIVEARGGGSTDAASPAANLPAAIFLIRHGEKPPAEANSSSLSAEGVLRAKAIPVLFVAAGKKPSRLPRPDVLFASAATKHSNREVETLEPLAAALHMPINNSFDERDAAGLTKEIFSGKYAGKVVLLCWHHTEIPHLARAMGVDDAPKWHDEVFDQVWRIDWPDGKLRFTTLPEELLPGDSVK